jgi:hypothetical protein
LDMFRRSILSASMQNSPWLQSVTALPGPMKIDQIF